MSDSNSGTWFAIIAWLMACGGGGSAPQPLEYRVVASNQEPAARPVRDPLPTVLIDGEPRTALAITYADIAEAAEEEHLVELAFGDVVVSRRSVRPSLEPCGITGEIHAYEQSICLYTSGDLRFAGELIRAETGVCVGDGFCLACGACGQNQRCTSLVVLRDPFASHLGCAPIGPRALGDACSLNNEVVAFDDCGQALLCVDGVCRQTCNPAFPGDCGCTFVEGHAPELGICTQ